MPTLEVKVLGSAGTVPITQATTTIGRRPDQDVHIVERTVSGRHAQIVRQDDLCFLEDLGSRNGTFVNGRRILERTPLRHNDRIKFGDADALFLDAPRDLDEPGIQPQANHSAIRCPNVDTGDASRDSSVLVSFAEGSGDHSTITGSVDNQSRFGSLETNPSAKLKAVLDISSSLAGTVDLESMLPTILDRLFHIFRFADRGCVLLKDERTGEMVPRAFKQRRGDDDATVRLSRTIVSRVLAEKIGILSADASHDLQFHGSESISELKIRSIMCVPLLGLDDDPKGVISIDSQNPLGRFSTDDLELLMAVAGQAALSYETARLLAAYVEKQKQDNEMQIAQDIQRGLLPHQLPRVDGYQFFASYDSAQAVGGDYYDCHVLPDGRIAVSLGDVAGKGVPAALIMSRMSSCVQSTLQHVQDLSAAMMAINRHMCDSAVEGRFVTYVLCIVDPQSHRVELSNAGHLVPIIRRGDGSIELTDQRNLAGPPIGVMEGYPYEAEVFSLNPGDLVVIVTDGVDEAMNPDDQQYGTERTIDFIRNGPSTPERLVQELVADVRRHAAKRPQTDDITVMAFGREIPAA